MEDRSSNRRIILNSVYIYIGVIFTTLFHFVTIPLLLNYLGEGDYGLYTLIAGVISMLAFVRSSMIVTVQRFLNVSYGQGDMAKVNTIFTVSLSLYVCVGVVTVLLIELLGPFISYSYLNIEPDRIDSAILLFQVLVFSTFFSTVSIPYDALFNVHEEMWLFSLCSVLDCFLRFLLAICVGFMPIDIRLDALAYGMAIIAFFVFFQKYLICQRRYRNITLTKLYKNDFLIVKDIFSFIGWNLYSTLARIFCNQGYAVVLNLFSGTIINSAYGIANQVNGALNQFTSSVEKAFNPQIMKSEGMQDRNRVVSLSMLSTKYCSLIYGFFSIPLMVTLPYVLEVWLSNVPEHTITFTMSMIISSMISMNCVGLTSIFYAIGEIKQYLLRLGTILVFWVFVAYGVMKLGYSADVAVALLVVLELVLLGLRLYYANKIGNMDVKEYLKKVLYPCVLPEALTFMVIYMIPCNSFLHLMVICSLSVIAYSFATYLGSFSEKEKAFVKKVLSNIKFKKTTI